MLGTRPRERNGQTPWAVLETGEREAGSGLASSSDVVLDIQEGRGGLRQGAGQRWQPPGLGWGCYLLWTHQNASVGPEVPLRMVWSNV